MAVAAYSDLISSAFAKPFSGVSPEDRHIFVLLTSEWVMLFIQGRTLESDTSSSLATEIVRRMADAAEYSLDAALPNCGCYFGVPWPLALWNARSQHFPVVDAAARGQYLRLFHALEQSVAKKLLSGPSSDVLSGLMQLVNGSPRADLQE